MTAVRFLGAGALAAVALAMGGCASIKESRGYIVDQTLTSSIQPGIDNRQSVQGTLGHPSFESQFGQPTWYYVSSRTARRPFSDPKIAEHQVLAVQFDAAGNVVSTGTGVQSVRSPGTAPRSGCGQSNAEPVELA